MAPKIFVTGITGYIGGDALYEIAATHPEYEIAALVRNSDKGAQVASQYSRIRLVYGSLDDEGIIEEEAKKADIILHCANADHEAGAKALIRGLASRENPERPGFLIHTSGTGVLTYQDIERKTFGEPSIKIYDDWGGISEIISLPNTAPHRKVDNIILDADSARVRTAIVCPPTIYGTGRGPGSQRGHQMYELARCTFEKKHGIQVEAGQARWTNVHVYDLSKCFLKLVESATAGGSGATWGKEGYYFTENGEHVWGEMSSLVAQEALKQGLIPSDKVSSLSSDEANQITRAGAVLWGANSRGRAIRARKILGWTPLEIDMVGAIPDIVASEARSLGLTKGHAAKVAG